MPFEEASDIFGNFSVSLGFGLKVFVVLFVVFYVVFALILYRQIQLMDRALPSPIAPFLKFVGILQIGVAMAFLFIVIGLF